MHTYSYTNSIVTYADIHDIERLDWMFKDDSEAKTPREAMYSFDAHYLWRDFADKSDVPGHDIIYTDRMRQQDSDKWNAAIDPESIEFGELGDLGPWKLRIKREDAQIICKRYFGEDTVCIGYGLDCNVSTGYELGIFLIQKPEHLEDQDEYIE